MPAFSPIGSSRLPTKLPSPACGWSGSPGPGTPMTACDTAVGRRRRAALSGFDPIALAPPARADVQTWRAHLDDLGEPHGGIVTGHQGGSVLVGLHDPDGIEIRLYAD